MVRRPSKSRYGENVAAEICRLVAGGERIAAVCAREGMPAASTVRRWRRERIDFAVDLASALRAAGPGRKGPVSLTEPLFAEICRRLADGEFLTAICRDGHMPSRRQVHERLRNDPAMRARYAAARELQVEHLFEEIVTIADEDDNPARARLRIEARKWLVVRLAPQRFGDGAADGPRAQAGLAELLEKARERIAHG